MISDVLLGSLRNGSLLPAVELPSRSVSCCDWWAITTQFIFFATTRLLKQMCRMNNGMDECHVD